MKKVKFERKFILLALVSLFIGYICLRYYIRPDWFDSEPIYHRVYNLKVTYKKVLKRLFRILISNLFMVNTKRNLLMINGQNQPEQI